MPTINTDNIQGFAEMTAEQKLDALLKLEIPEAVDLSGYVKKDVFDRTSSELAESKRQLKSKMTEDEAAAAEREAKWAEMEQKLARLEREKLESTYKASYLAMPGYDEALATDSAKAMADGDMAKVFANQQKATENAAKALKDELLKQFPTPQGAGGEETGEDPSVAFAKKLAKSRSESANESAKIMEHYLK